MLEHRYYGLSNPYDDLSVASLKFHTIQQAVDDLEYFAKNVVLPQPDVREVPRPGPALRVSRFCGGGTPVCDC